MRSIMLAIIFAFIASCASLSKKDCEQGDWFAIGKRDGSSGHNPQSRLSTHTKACEEHGITPDKVNYLKGHQEGIPLFCSNIGLSHGRVGKTGQRPRLCISYSHLYNKGFKDGFINFCNQEGVAAGKIADKTKVAKGCHHNSGFRTGFFQGLKTYCTEQNGMEIGKIAGENRSRYCPTRLRDVFMTGYNKGIHAYCGRKNGFFIGRYKKEFTPGKCPDYLRKEFQSGYEKGLKYQDISMRVGLLNKDIINKKATINAPATSGDLKTYLTSEVNRLEIQMKELQKEKYRIEGYVGN